MDIKDSIFRKKSLERVNSPEQLDAYLKVTSPSVWMVLAMIIVILVGVVIWGYYGKLETKVDAGCEVEETGTVTCYVNEDAGVSLKKDQDIIIEENRYKVEKVGTPINSNRVNDYVCHLLDAERGTYLYFVEAKCDLPSGAYKAQIVTDSVYPMKFVFN